VLKEETPDGTAIGIAQELVAKEDIPREKSL
jgi:hypothetical protein